MSGPRNGLYRNKIIISVVASVLFRVELHSQSSDVSSIPIARSIIPLMQLALLGLRYKKASVRANCWTQMDAISEFQFQLDANPSA